MDCLFCKIADKEIPSQIIYEDEKVLAFLDINPRSLGHTVIIPKTHAQNILDLPEDLAGPLFLGVKKVTNLLQKSLKPAGFTIGINHGKISGQVIKHLHIHVMPRFEGDGGGSVHDVVNNPPKESIEETARKIKNQK